MVQGKSVDEARAILSEYGTVDIQTWPGFVGSIPSLAWRLTLTIDTGSVTPSPGPSSTGPVPPTAVPTTAPSSAASAGTVERSVGWPARWLLEPMSRLLGIDLGERRIGIAVAELDGLAVPLVTIRRAREVARDASAIQRLIDEHGVTELIVGLPLEASGREGAQVAITRAWVDVDPAAARLASRSTSATSG